MVHLTLSDRLTHISPIRLKFLERETGRKRNIRRRAGWEMELRRKGARERERDLEI